MKGKISIQISLILVAFYLITTFSGIIRPAAAATPSVTKFGADPANTVSGHTIIFFCNYSNSANEPPSYVRIAKQFTTSPIYDFTANDSFTNYVVGKSYHYTWYYFPYMSTFLMSLTTKSATSGIVTKLIPMALEPAPTLIHSGITPMSNQTGTFSFFTNYTNIFNFAPSYVKVNVDGTDYSMSKNNSGDITFVDGVNYSYSLSLSIGNHTYFFKTITTYGYAPMQTVGTFWIEIQPSPKPPTDWNLIGFSGILLTIIGGIFVWCFHDKKK